MVWQKRDYTKEIRGIIKAKFLEKQTGSTPKRRQPWNWIEATPQIYRLFFTLSSFFPLHCNTQSDAANYDLIEIAHSVAAPKWYVALRLINLSAKLEWGNGCLDSWQPTKSNHFDAWDTPNSVWTRFALCLNEEVWQKRDCNKEIREEKQDNSQIPKGTKTVTLKIKLRRSHKLPE